MLLVNQAKEIIERIQYITLATVCEDGSPRNSPVYCGYDDQYNFYRTSRKENQHSKNIMSSGEVFIVIYDSTTPEGTGKGVYISALAQELDSYKEIDTARRLIYGRKDVDPREVEDFLGDHPRRMYQAIPKNIWINDSGEIGGNYVDTRVEIGVSDFIKSQGS